jgi:hypothetical protein
MRLTSTSVVVIAILALAALSGEAVAAEKQILGKRLVLRDPTGDEASRSVKIVGRESKTDIAGIAGDPVGGGGTLQIGVNSGSFGESFFLDASGWSATPTGFRYTGPTDPDGDPVESVVIRRTPSGKALLEIVLRGDVGVQPLDLVPPDPGSDAVAILSLTSGDVYCVSFGGAAGGQETVDTAKTWKMRNASAEPGCPALCCSLANDSCTWLGTTDSGSCLELNGTAGSPGSACDGQTGACAPPPSGAGNCCEFYDGLPCFGGPGVSEMPCGQAGGQFASNAVCQPDRTCVVE